MAVQVEYGLPWLQMGCILAHQCMSAWLWLSGCRGLPDGVNKGLCQLMSLFWLDAQQQAEVRVSEGEGRGQAALRAWPKRASKSAPGVSENAVKGCGMRGQSEA